MTMTEVAVVFGIEPGTVWAETASSSESRCLVVVRRARCARGVALALASDSEFELSLADDFGWACWRCGTPVGRTSFGLSSSGEMSRAKQVKPNATAQKKEPARSQKLMGGKLAAKIQCTQAVTDLFRATCVQFRSLPAHRRPRSCSRRAFCADRLRADNPSKPIPSRIFLDHLHRTPARSSPF